MSVLVILVPLALLLALSAVVAFVWGTATGQLDDLVTPALRILGDDEDAAEAVGAAEQTEGAPTPDDDPAKTRRGAIGEAFPFRVGEASRTKQAAARAGVTTPQKRHG